jgi:hypothetical protein
MSFCPSVEAATTLSAVVSLNMNRHEGDTDGASRHRPVSGSPIIAVLRHYGVPVNRREYLNVAYMGNPPADLDPESEAELQDDARLWGSPPVTHEEEAAEEVLQAEYDKKFLDYQRDEYLSWCYPGEDLPDDPPEDIETPSPSNSGEGLWSTLHHHRRRSNERCERRRSV